MAAPFVTAGLFRLDIASWGVAMLCALVVPAVLILAPKQDSRWLAIGWIAGCVTDALFLVWLLSVWGSGMAEFGS